MPYRELLHQELSQPIEALRARKSTRLPTVLTKEEVGQVLQVLSSQHQLMAQLLYGSGLRTSSPPPVFQKISGMGSCGDSIPVPVRNNGPLGEPDNGRA